MGPDEIVEALCSVTGDRRPGSAGNDAAVDLVAGRLRELGWQVSLPEFPVLDWVGGDGSITVGATQVPLMPSPYGLGVAAEGRVRVARNLTELVDLEGTVLVATGDLVEGPLTPKAYPFYGSEEHTEIIDRIESQAPVAVVAVTGKHPPLCGAIDPYPWIEDGDFTIPAASVSPADARPLLEADGSTVRIELEAERLPSSARNVVARRGPAGRRVTVCAHIDTKPGTPGAVDNAAGVAVLVLLAERLAAEEPAIGVELLAVNGEDHFAGAGEAAWLTANDGRLDDVALFVNIDGAGYRGGRTAFSFYNVERPGLAATLEAAGLVEGPPWFQSDHAIFAMQGRPAVACTTEAIDELLEHLFHAPTDTPDQVDGALLVELAEGLAAAITAGLI